jgi:predicted lipid-binding transport protein (Tim44 family)
LITPRDAALPQESDVMGDSGFAYLDIVFFAMIALFLILRLRSVLGRRTGNENSERWTSRPPRPAPGQTGAPGNVETPLPDNVTRLPDRGAKPTSEQPPVAEAGSPLDVALNQIRQVDRSFDPRGFVTGARGAFEMVVPAFAQGDTATLRPLLSDEVYEQFASAIRTRQEAKQTLETTLIGIRNVDLTDARLDGRNAVVTVKIVSDQVNVTRDANGAVVEGDPNHVSTITDLWTFARDTRSRDPNWQLVATAAQQ